MSGPPAGLSWMSPSLADRISNTTASDTELAPAGAALSAVHQRPPSRSSQRATPTEPWRGEPPPGQPPLWPPEPAADSRRPSPALFGREPPLGGMDLLGRDPLRDPLGSRDLREPPGRDLRDPLGSRDLRDPLGSHDLRDPLSVRGGGGVLGLPSLPSRTPGLLDPPRRATPPVIGQFQRSALKPRGVWLSLEETSRKNNGHDYYHTTYIFLAWYFRLSGTVCMDQHSCVWY